MITTNNFICVDRNIYAYFRNNYDCMHQLVDYIQAYNMYCASNKLTPSGAFFVTNRKTTERLGFSRPKVIRHKKMLEEMGFIETELINNITYIRLNIKKINEIQNKKYNIPKVDDYIEEAQQEREEIMDEYDLMIKQGCFDDKTAIVIKDDSIKIDKDEVKLLWNNIANKYDLSKVRIVSNDNIKSIRNIMKELKIKDVNQFYSEIDNAINNSEFLRGNNDRGWKINFGFTTQKSSMLKLFNNSYVTNKNNSYVRLSFQEQEALRRREYIEMMFKKKEEEQKLIECE